MRERRVVVTGLGALTPIGNSVEDYWKSLIDGVSGASPISYFDTSNFKTKIACELKAFDPLDSLDKREVRINDPFVQYALIACAEAVDHSEIKFRSLDLTRAGVIWGTGNGGIQSFHDEVIDYAKANGVPRYNPYFIPRTIVNMASGVISIKYGLQGVSFSPISACATANTCFIEAYNYIKWGHQDVIIAGASDAAINESGIAGFIANKALSKKNDTPTKASRPFDKDRDGFVMGEGAGALVFEELEHAKKRGAKIYAEFVGGAMTSDAYHLTATHPEGYGGARAIRQTLHIAEIEPEEVDYINAHAASTALGDISEINAMQSVFGRCNPAISSTKSMTGHLLGAAGAVEAIACIKTIENSKIPPSINIDSLDDRIPALTNIVSNEFRKQTVDVALSNSFGFGGHNAVVAFKKYY